MGFVLHLSLNAPSAERASQVARHFLRLMDGVFPEVGTAFSSITAEDNQDNRAYLSAASASIAEMYAASSLLVMTATIPLLGRHDALERADLLRRLRRRDVPALWSADRASTVNRLLHVEAFFMCPGQTELPLTDAEPR